MLWLVGSRKAAFIKVFLLWLKQSRLKHLSNPATVCFLCVCSPLSCQNKQTKKAGKKTCWEFEKSWIVSRGDKAKASVRWLFWDFIVTWKHACVTGFRFSFSFLCERRKKISKFLICCGAVVLSRLSCSALIEWCSHLMTSGRAEAFQFPWS